MNEKQLKKFMDEQFKPIFKIIIKDCVKFGTCVLKYTKDEEGLKLKRLDLSHYEFEIGIERRRS